MSSWWKNIIYKLNKSSFTYGLIYPLFIFSPSKAAKDVPTFSIPCKSQDLRVILISNSIIFYLMVPFMKRSLDNKLPQALSIPSLIGNQLNFHWLNQLFAFSLIHQWKKYFLLSNQSIFTEIISEIWLIYSNLFLAIWVSQISLIISRFWLIQI